MSFFSLNPPPTPASGGQPAADHEVLRSNLPRWRGLGVENDRQDLDTFKHKL